MGERKIDLERNIEEQRKLKIVIDEELRLLEVYEVAWFLNIGESVVYEKIPRSSVPGASVRIDPAVVKVLKREGKSFGRRSLKTRLERTTNSRLRSKPKKGNLWE